MKIVYVFNQLIVCGGVIVPFEHCKQLKKRGFEAYIVGKEQNEELNKRSNIYGFDFLVEKIEGGLVELI